MSDRLQTAYFSPNVPASGGLHGKLGYSGSDFISEYVTFAIQIWLSLCSSYEWFVVAPRRGPMSRHDAHARLAVDLRHAFFG